MEDYRVTLINDQARLAALADGLEAVTISGIELAQKIRKGQFDTSAVTMRDRASVRHVWEAVLAA